MRKVTEYIKSQLDRSALNSFDTIAAKFDPKKIEAAITLVLGKQGLYETYYYEALLNQIMEKLKNSNYTKLIADVNSIIVTYEELPNYEAIESTVNEKYGKETVDEIVEEIGNEAESSDDDDDDRYSGRETTKTSTTDSEAWKQAAIDEAKKQAEETSKKTATEAVIDTVNVPGEVSDPDEQTKRRQEDFLNGATKTEPMVGVNERTGETVSLVDLLNGKAGPGDYTVKGITDGAENVRVTTNEEGKTIIVIENTHLTRDDQGNITTTTDTYTYYADTKKEVEEGAPGSSEPGSSSPGNIEPGSDTPCFNDCSNDCINDCSNDCSTDCSTDCPTDCSTDCPFDCSNDCSNDCSSDCSTDCSSDNPCSTDCSSDNPCIGDCIYDGSCGVDNPCPTDCGIDIPCIGDMGCVGDEPPCDCGCDDSCSTDGCDCNDWACTGDGLPCDCNCDDY